MPRLLILFARSFPYGIHEPFLENEYPLYKDQFDKVLIVTACRRDQSPSHIISDPTIEVLRDYTLSGDLLSILQALPHMLTDKMFYRELKHLFRKGHFSFSKLRELLAISLCANHRATLTMRWLRKHKEYQPTVLYSYWMHITAYAAVKLKRKLKTPCHTVSRAHGFDLYLERHSRQYIPFHRQIYANLDEIAATSHSGKEYLEERYGMFHKITVHPLGALDMHCENPAVSRKTLRILTCSRTIPLKRLNRLVDALSRMPHRAIHWTHIGSGESQASLERMAAEKLPSNITAEFSGRISNRRIYETYRSQPFHIIVNLSESEGLPISIMEAMSFGIPVIATDVGGTAELVDQGKNGFLLRQDFQDQELIQLIDEIIEMPEEAYLALRQASREKFLHQYHAVNNFTSFIRHIAESANATIE